jgi:hypothetical protein
MDQAAKERLQHEIQDEASQRFPGAVDSAVVLQHGDEPRHVQRGEMTIRVLIKPEGPDGQPRPLRAFGEMHRPEIEQFRRDLAQRLPEARQLQFTLADATSRRKMIVAPLGRSAREGGWDSDPAASDLTPVMARLGPAELEIVDTLISAGVAANRAEAIRWALVRISERPAYTQLREHTRDIERLKTEF